MEQKLKLYFDTETTGIFNGWQRDFHNHAKFPAIMSFAGVLVDDEWNTVDEYHKFVILGEDIQVHPKAEEVHGISWEKCQAEGVELGDVLFVFHQMVEKARLLVGYNTDFDLGMMEISWYRWKAIRGEEIKRVALPQVLDLMKFATPICGLPPTEKMKAAGRFHNKSANLTEAMRIICNHDHSGAHDALADVKACIMLHKKIKEMQDARRV